MTTEKERADKEFHYFIGMYSGTLMKAFHKEFGDKALRVIGNVGSQLGEMVGKMLVNQTGSRAFKDIVQAYVEARTSVLGYKIFDIELEKLSEEKAIIKFPRCILGIENASRELCEALDKTYFEAMFKAAGLNVDVIIGKALTARDDYCQLLLTIKK